MCERLSSERVRMMGVAIAQHELGHVQEAQQAVDALTAKHAQVAPYGIARVHAWRGEYDLAFQWLERAYARHDRALRDVKVDPLLRKLHGDPRYTELLRKMSLPLD